MKIEMRKKLELSFAAMGVSAQQVAEAMKRLSEATGFNAAFERKAAYKRRCILIAFAMSQTCSPKKKFILWNLYKNTTL